MRALIPILCSVAASALYGADEPLVVARQFTAQLKLEQKADEELFAAAGKDRSKALLLDVVHNGRSASANAADWEGLHRALSGLIELYTWSGELFSASIYAGMQQTYYITLDEDYVSALDFSKRAYDLHEKSGQKLSQFLNLRNIGENLLHLARPREALDYFHRAQECMDSPTSSSAFATWRDVVKADLVAHDFAAAEIDLQKFQEAARSGNIPFRAQSILAESDIRIAQGRFSEALNTLKRAQTEMVNDPAAVMFSYEIAGELLGCVLDAMSMLPYDDSVALSHRMVAEFPGLPISIGTFAEQAIRMRRRMAGEIDSILREDNSLLRDARSSGDIPQQIELLRSLAVSYRACGARKQEIAALEEAETLGKGMISQTGQDSSTRLVTTMDHLRTVQQLAEAYLAAGDLAHARHGFDQVLSILAATTDMNTRQRIASYYGHAMLGKARLAELDEDLDEARSILEKAISEKPIDARFDRAESLAQFARLELDAGEKPARAIDLYHQALAKLETGRDRTTEIVTRFELALYFAIKGAKLPDAAQQASVELDRVEQAARAAKLADNLWRASYVRGILAESAGRRDQAIASYGSAVDQLEAIRSGLSDGEQRQAFMDNATADDLYKRLVAALIFAGRPDEAWKYVERSKARAFLEMLQGRRFRDTAPETAELRALEQKLIALEVQLAGNSQPAMRSAGKIPAVLEAEKTDLQNRFALLRTQSAVTGAARTQQASVLSTRAVNVPELQASLPLHAALIEYYFLDRSLCAFAVTKSTNTVVCREIGVAALRQNVVRARRLLAIANPGDDLAPLLKEIGAAVIDPVLAALGTWPGSTRDLLIVPAGFLNYLPFQVLPLASGEPLIEQFTVSYLPSASTLRSLGDRTAQTGDLSLLALGNISVDGMVPLPGTLREVADIAKVTPGAERVTQGAFTHDALRRALETHDQVHIATHGLLDEHAPLFSALVTSPAAGQPARLSLYELTALDLKARLVVMSACETGLGTLLAGDEVVGLTRTFLQAGAATVVSSLWQVSDESTALLMAEFHRLMGTGEGPAQALREASLKVRKQFPQPFYWAPFILTGAR